MDRLHFLCVSLSVPPNRRSILCVCVCFLMATFSEMRAPLKEVGVGAGGKQEEGPKMTSMNESLIRSRVADQPCLKVGPIASIYHQMDKNDHVALTHPPPWAICRLQWKLPAKRNFWA